MYCNKFDCTLHLKIIFWIRTDKYDFTHIVTREATKLDCTFCFKFQLSYMISVNLSFFNAVVLIES
jgi:hypothetical protein